MAQHSLRPGRDSRSTGMLGRQLGSEEWPVFQEFSSWRATGYWQLAI